MKHFSGQASRDRLQIALHVLALAHAALEPRKQASHTCGANCNALAALPAFAAPDLPAWTAVNPFRPLGASADRSNPSVPPHPARQGDLLTASGQRSSTIAIAGARDTPRGCPALRRQLKARGSCLWRVAGRPVPMALKTTLSTLHSSNVLSILSARSRPPRELSCWLEEPDPAAAVAAGMRRWKGCVPAGWLGLLEQTLGKLLAMARSPARKNALKGLSIFCHGVELGFSLPVECDASLRGIARRAEATSRCTCSACGSPGRRREIGEEGAATLCARCAAPLLLHWDLWELGQSLRFLRAVNVPIVESQIPPLLRSSFCRQAAAHPEDFGPQGKARMIPPRFLTWASQWQTIGERLAGLGGMN